MPTLRKRKPRRSRRKRREIIHKEGPKVDVDVPRNDPSHFRSRGAVGKKVKLPSAYWGSQFGKQNPNTFYIRWIVGFVPAADAKKDRWIVHDPGEDLDQLPLRLKTLKELTIGDLGPVQAANVAEPSSNDGTIASVS